MNAPPPPPLLALDAVIPSRKIKTVSCEQVVLPMCPLTQASSFDIQQHVEWESAVGVGLLAGGDSSRGVIAIEVIPRKVLIVKGTPNIGGEIFGCLLANEFGLLAPRCRMVEYSPIGFVKGSNAYREWRSIKQIVKKIPEQDARHSKMSKDLNRAFLLVMEFLPGIPLKSLGEHPTVFEKLIVDGDNMILNDLGRMIVMDILINNWDRIPAGIWEHDGNPGNVMIDTIRKRLILIDQTVSEIQQIDHFERYLKKVKHFVSSVKTLKECPELTTDNPLDIIVEYLQQFGNGKLLSTKAKRQILNGCCEALDIVKTLTTKKLENMKNAVNEMKTGRDWENVWEFSIGEINIHFMTLVRNAMVTVWG